MSAACGGRPRPWSRAALARVTGRTVLFLAGHLDEADEAADDIEVFSGRVAHLLPAWELDIGTDHINDEIAGERLRVCNLLAGGVAPRQGQDGEVVVAPVMSLVQAVPSPSALDAGRMRLQRGDEMNIEALASWLVDGGFESVDQVDQQGQFARRGGIVDIFPSGTSEAVRIEFFGDQIDSIRQIELDSQRSTAQLDGYDVTAVKAGRPEDPSAAASLLDYLPADAIVVVPSLER